MLGQPSQPITAITAMNSYRIITPYSRGPEVTPTHLQETDFERMGTLVDYGPDTKTQNARLLIPVTVEMSYPQHNIIYPKNAYIRLYHYRDAVPVVHLISPHPLPALNARG